MRFPHVIILSIIVFCLLFVFFITLGIFKQNNTNKIFPKPETMKITFPKFNNSFIDVSKFNYNGDCGKVFSHPPNSEKDYVIGSFDFRNKCVSRTMWDSLNLARSSMPNAHIVLLLFSLPNPKCTDDLPRLAKLNIEIQKVAKPPRENAVIARYNCYYNFIEANYNKISRIIFIDPKDVAFFNDFFATFSEDDIGWLVECFGFKIPEQCYGPFSYRSHAEWLRSYFSKEVRDDFVKRKLPSLNGGFGYGGVEKMRKVLQIYTSKMDKTNKHWGYDQALLNVLYYNGSFDEVGMKSITCEQKLCYIGRYTMAVKDKVIYYNNTQCSPVAMHKFDVKSTQWRLV
ncbi:hypothetical protein EIN_347170 [Entamoeba invadens IP1]|uniref:Hexosyltransferase n=1 Tax=Entamoeba invadens IP1 TaxID=370355 RepID=L7FK86_ENTIV|nr:hypothetical protein EIN_347170 [Entamoeba invadens IP1]ELP84030.1 hypothetical protein EIN_347170 [Entamoeba invadens IP1]|eukprot:XP_004183376.1 hypothetical protein EIN_347170 [Entamoeba invadens IP1]